jgi:hypothetical protein
VLPPGHGSEALVGTLEVFEVETGKTRFGLEGTALP